MHPTQRGAHMSDSGTDKPVAKPPDPVMHTVGPTEPAAQNESMEETKSEEASEFHDDSSSERMLSDDDSQKLPRVSLNEAMSRVAEEHSDDL